MIGNALRLLATICLLVLGSPSLLSAQPILSIAITQAEGEDFGSATVAAKAAGATATSLSLSWDDLEPEPGLYKPRNDWPKIANDYYPTLGLDITVTFALIDTVQDRRPDDLKGRAWDDPELLARFIAHLETVMPKLDRLKIHSIAIGNEVDVYFQSDAEFVAFARFLEGVKAWFAAHHPGIPIGTKLTAAIPQSRFRDAALALIARSDAAMFTYYPLDSAYAMEPLARTGETLDGLEDLADGKPIYLLEAGAPSSGCKATPDTQRDFLETLLEEAERRSFALVSLIWLSDITPAQITTYQNYYGVKDRCFASYLGSLGLRDGAGHPKAAYHWLVQR